ncbi:uncharacterized protein LOC112504921, partial [Cynara cardunculus var. scolymus]|uniref:uncharacterized protein LOC112504921 n=1 Tax=Cynara cardunculus var. scolymus TaxID=59895 RepID=UPI000D62A893
MWNGKNPKILPNSFAHVISGSNKHTNENFHFIPNICENVDSPIDIPVSVVKKSCETYAKTLCGYFVGRRLPFPVVRFYASKLWSQFGIEDVLLNGHGIFLFKFNSVDGLQKVIDNGPWSFKNIPIFIQKWRPGLNLNSNLHDKIPLWVRIHDIPYDAWNDEGLSYIASKIGIPLAMDSWTANMCKYAAGKSAFARVLLEVPVRNNWIDEVKVRIPDPDTLSTTLYSLRVEYEWKPPVCTHCHIFGHSDSVCIHIISQSDSSVKSSSEQLNLGKKTLVDSEGFQTRIHKQSQKPKATTPILRKEYKKKETRPPTLTGKQAKEKLKEKMTAPPRQEAPKDRRPNPPQGFSPPFPSPPWDDLLDEDEMIEVESDDGDTARFVARDLPIPQRAVRNLVRESNLNICAALESRASVSSLPSICERVFGSWTWASNGSLCLRGTRIIVAWNPVHVDMMLLNATDQVMHFQVKIRDSSKILFLSVVYADNYHIARRQLWASLKGHKHVVKDTPWFIMGDFNVALDPKDISSGISGPNRGMDDFLQCVRHLEVEDVNYKGLFFTWSKNPNGTGGLLKKIDRVLGNSHSLAHFPSASVIFLPYRSSDHCPAVLTLPSRSPWKPKPFKFPNFLTHKEAFLSVVASSWSPDLSGYEMYKIFLNLKNLKGPIRKLLKDQGNLFSNVSRIRLELDRVQIALDRDPENVDLREEH